MHRHRPLLVVAIASVLSLIVGAAASIISSPSDPDGPSSTGADRASARTRLPLRFEPNVGQTDPRVRFVARGATYQLFLTGAGAVLSMPTGDPSRPLVLRIRPVGSQPSPEISGIRPLAGVSNYLSGSDPSTWSLGVPGFEAVRYENVYPGVDLRFRGGTSGPEYDVMLAAGVDPSLVRFAFSGAGDPSIGPDGSLILHGTGGVTIRQPVPSAYQTVVGARRPVAVSFVLDRLGHVGFRLGPHDSSLPLMIDPAIVSSTFLGGEHSDLGNAVAVDQSGNVLVTGQTDSLRFPRRLAFQRRQGRGICGFGFTCRDAFVTKLSSTGTSLVFSTYLGGNSDDFGRGVAVDPSGNVYVTGNTASPNFPVRGALQSSFAGGTCGETGCIGDAFVAKFSVTGSLVYSTYLGGSADDQANGIAVDAGGSAYVAGWTFSSTFPTAGAFQPTRVGIRDAFVTKLAPTGASLSFSTFLGGTETGFDLTEQANAIAVDGTGSAYVTGTTSAANFPIKNAFQPTCGGGCASARTDVFVTKFVSAGNALAYSTYLGGFDVAGNFGHDIGNGVAVNAAGEAFVTGFTNSPDYPVTTGAFQRSFQGGDEGVGGDAFVTRLAASGSSLVYSTYLGGQHDDTAQAIAIDTAGNAHIAGYTDSGNFPLAQPFQSSLLGNFDAFVTKVNPTGTGLAYSSFLGGSQGDVISFSVATGVAVDGSGNAYYEGWTNVRDFRIVNAFQPAIAGEYDTFITKVTP